MAVILLSLAVAMSGTLEGALKHTQIHEVDGLSAYEDGKVFFLLFV